MISAGTIHGNILSILGTVIAVSIKEQSSTLSFFILAT